MAGVLGGLGVVAAWSSTWAAGGGGGGGEAAGIPPLGGTQQLSMAGSSCRGGEDDPAQRDTARTRAVRQCRGPAGWRSKIQARRLQNLVAVQTNERGTPPPGGPLPGGGLAASGGPPIPTPSSSPRGSRPSPRPSTAALHGPPLLGVAGMRAGASRRARRSPGGQQAPCQGPWPPAPGGGPRSLGPPRCEPASQCGATPPLPPGGVDHAAPLARRLNFLRPRRSLGRTDPARTLPGGLADPTPVSSALHAHVVSPEETPMARAQSPMDNGGPYSRQRRMANGGLWMADGEPALFVPSSFHFFSAVPPGSSLIAAREEQGPGGGAA